MGSQFDEEQLVELTSYLRNIKSYEKQILQSERSTTTMISGMLIFIAGLLDISFVPFVNYSPFPVPWFICIAGMLIARKIITTQPLLFSDINEDISEKRQEPNKIEILITTFLMLLTFPISAININYIMPYIGVVFGLTNLVAYHHGAGDEGLELGDWAVILAFFGSSFVTLIGAIIFGENFYLLGGLIFGLLVGGVIYFRGYSIRQVVDRAI